NALDLVGKSLLDAKVAAHELPVLAERPGAEASRLAAERAELPPLALRAPEVPGRALPVDVGHLGLLGHAAKRAPKGTVRPSSLQILMGLVDLGFRRGAVLIVSALTTTTAIGRRCGRLRQRVAKPVARRPCRLSPRLLHLSRAEAL